MTPAAPAKDASSSWVKKKTNIANQSEVDYKKLALVNDDLLKVLSLLLQSYISRLFVKELRKRELKKLIPKSLYSLYNFE